jgi:trimeric autotransporter adhesin
MRCLVLLLAALGAAQGTLCAQPAVITNSPASRAVWVGVNVTFAVGASGAGPLTYQWQLNSAKLTNGVISTVAGNGTGAYAGDGGLATLASLWGPTDVKVDSSGNLFIADIDNDRVRKVGTNGLITTLAGDGSSTFSGDSGPATNAGMNPWGVGLDSSGNLFIADHSNNRIREVGANGVINTVAGDNSRGYGGDGGPATGTDLDYPPSVAVDASGDMFIADLDNHRVREVTNDIITTVAGNGTLANTGDGGLAVNASLCYPDSVAVDGAGNLFIADFYTNRIRKVSSTGVITNFAGAGPAGFSGDGGPALLAGLNAPIGLSLDSSGNVFFADGNNSRIRKVGTNGIITTIAGTNAMGYAGDGGLATNASLYYPSAATVDSFGNVFIADTDNNRIRKVLNTQGPSLALNGVSAANAGNYQVVVSGPGGSVTSTVAKLTVASSPLIEAFVHNAGGSVSLAFVSRPGSTNMLMWATNLTPPIHWQVLSTNVAGGDGAWQYNDTTATTSSTRFYRFFME